MKFLYRLFPAGHFIIGVMFLLSSVALIVVAALQFWHGIQFFGEEQQEESQGSHAFQYPSGGCGKPRPEP